MSLNTKDQRGDFIKELERTYETKVQPIDHFIIRLDGHKFSKFTKQLKTKEEPFNKYFINAMVRVMNDLIEEFKAKCGYTHSDEITLIFSAAMKPDDEIQKSHYNSGRIQKLVSQTAAYCSVRFQYHLQNEYEQEMKDNRYKPEICKIRTLIRNTNYYFDARLFVIPEENIIDHMLFRSVDDCNRNAVSTYALGLYSHKKLHKKSTNDQIQMLKSCGINWVDIPLYIRHGIYAKKVLYEKIVSDSSPGSVNSTVLRSQISNKCFKLPFRSSMTEDQIKQINNLFIEKYWQELDFIDFVEFNLEV